MLFEQTIQKMEALKLYASADVFRAHQTDPSSSELSYNELVGQMVDAQFHFTEQKRQDRLQKAAKLKITGACVENIDFSAPRGLNRSVMSALNTGAWVDKHQNLLLVGPTGTGKTYLACAQANQCIRRGIPVLYKRLSRLLEETEIARADGSLVKLRTRIQKVGLLILDDWGIAPLTAANRQDLMEIIEDRSGSGSVAITSQLPVEKWHEWLGEATVADAILDRLVHNAHKIKLKSDSMRKLEADKEVLS